MDQGKTLFLADFNQVIDLRAKAHIQSLLPGESADELLGHAHRLFNFLVDQRMSISVQRDVLEKMNNLLSLTLESTKNCIVVPNDAVRALVIYHLSVACLVLHEPIP